MEHFAQTNVFVRIRTVFARIRTVFAHLIIGCAIRYPKIGCLRYKPGTCLLHAGGNLVYFLCKVGICRDFSRGAKETFCAP